MVELEDLETKVNTLILNIYLCVLIFFFYLGSAFTILDDDKELKSFKHIINSIESVKIKILPIAIEKPIFEYADNELEDLNLIVESDLEVLHKNENNIEENGNKIMEDNKQSKVASIKKTVIILIS